MIALASRAKLISSKPSSGFDVFGNKANSLLGSEHAISSMVVSKSRCPQLCLGELLSYDGCETLAVILDELIVESRDI